MLYVHESVRRTILLDVQTSGQAPVDPPSYLMGLLPIEVPYARNSTSTNITAKLAFRGRKRYISGAEGVACIRVCMYVHAYVHIDIIFVYLQ